MAREESKCLLQKQDCERTGLAKVRAGPSMAQSDGLRPSACHSPWPAELGSASAELGGSEGVLVVDGAVRAELVPPG
eukprot:scaffold45384_cov18-Tisochrysis_lutea.AAC.1